LKEALANPFSIEWYQRAIQTPSELGVTEHSMTVSELREYIDWTPFFRTWELHGKFPAILEDNVVGEEAKKLYADALEMLDQIANENWLQYKGVVGIYPANAAGDDIELYANESRQEIIHTVHTMRQQGQKAANVPNIALSDFIAPKDSGVKDYLGGFAVTAGLGIKEHVDRFEADHDDYKSILLKALADRLAEAFAEALHEKVRKSTWGYEPTESFDNEALIKEKYRGIRPAPGYPACPDHTEKIGLFDLLNVPDLTGITLTDSLAMMPAASVSGWYFAHPQSKYFGVGKISQDQVNSLAERKGYPVDKMERWLSSSLH